MRESQRGREKQREMLCVVKSMNTILIISDTVAICKYTLSTLVTFAMRGSEVDNMGVCA